MRPFTAPLTAALALTACAIRYDGGSWQIVNPVVSKQGG